MDAISRPPAARCSTSGAASTRAELAALAALPAGRHRRARRPRARGAARVVRRHGRGRGDPVGQDRRLPRGLSLLRAVRALRHAREGDPLPRPGGGRRGRARDGEARRERVLPRATRCAGPTRSLMERILALVPVVQREGLQVAVSAGILTREQAERFAAGGVHRYNHNLETARSFFPQIVTTHSVGGALGDLPAREGDRHGALLRRAARHGRERRAAARAARAAPRARALRGADQLPEPAAGHAARRPAARAGPRGAALDRAVPARPARHDPSLRGGPRGDSAAISRRPACAPASTP